MSKVVDLIQARVVATLRPLLPAAQPIHGDSDIANDLGLDSLAMMELMLALEDRFDISIPLERIAKVSTVDDLVATVKAVLQPRQGRSVARSPSSAAALAETGRPASARIGWKSSSPAA